MNILFSKFLLLNLEIWKIRGGGGHCKTIFCLKHKKTKKKQQVNNRSHGEIGYELIFLAESKYFLTK